MKEKIDNNPEDGIKEFSRRDFLRMIVGFSVGSLGLKSERVESFMDKEGPFNPETQKEVLEEVAKEMKIKLESRIPAPVVLMAEQISDKEYNKIMGFDNEGRRTNRFLPPNTIFLISESKIHNLAHELTHYLQYNYLRRRILTLADDDQAESEAVEVQNKFRDFKSKRRP